MLILQQFIVQYQIDRSETAARRINLAGRQRMLSQRISKCLLLLRTRRELRPDSVVLKELSQALADLDRAHEILAGRNADDLAMRLTGAGSMAEFMKSEPYYQAVSRSAARVIALEGRSNSDLYYEVVLKNEQPFLARMEGTVRQLSREATNDIEALKRLEYVLLAMALVLLVAEAFLVFRPAMRTLAHQFNTLRLRIREAQEARRIAEQAVKSRAAFIASMSHEIRTPLNGIMGMSALLQDSELSRTQKDQLGVISSSASALLSVLNDILDYSKLENGVVDLELIPFDAAQIAEEVALLGAPLAHRKGVSIQCQVLPRVPGRLIGDPTRFRQIVTNLVNNAVKFTDQGSVTIELDYDDGVLVLSVIDTGIGISPEGQEKLFRQYSQADETITRRFGGTGLGLSIVKLLSEAYGGRVELESELGKGSIFRSYLPMEPVTGLDSSPKLRAGLRIAAIDDDPFSLDILRNYIEQAGSEISTASSADAFFTLVEESSKPFDVYLIDMDLRTTNGIEIAKWLESHDQSPRVLITSVTMDPRKHPEVKGLFRGVVQKPIRRQQLIESVEYALVPNAGGTVGLPTEPASAGNALVIEDNEINQMVLRSMLQKIGFTVTVVADGGAGLDAFSLDKYDVVVTDFEMPGLSGPELAYGIRQLPTGQSVRIVCVSGRSSPEDERVAKESGVDIYLLKPVQFPQFRDAVTVMS
ncbi:MAG: response regulator [Fimbriimonadaceae bacterium]|nr:response regulator [Fimbriimonadaceae bacterium]